MVADKVEVSSKKAGAKEAWKWVSDGKSGFEITKDVKEKMGQQLHYTSMMREKSFLADGKLKT